MEDFVEKWPFEGAVPHWVALESRTCSGVSHSTARRRLNKLRTPHCWSFFDKVMETCPTASPLLDDRQVEQIAIGHGDRLPGQHVAQPIV